MNWYREDVVDEINQKLIAAMKINDDEVIDSILTDAYIDGKLYDDELYVNRPRMRLAYKLLANEHKSICIADFACGHGELIKKLAYDGYNTYAIDYSATRVKLLEDSGVIAKKANIENTTFRDKAFDVVICMECLEHVKDVVKACAEIHRCLKRGGIVIVTVPYMKNCESSLHVRQFDQVKLASLFVDHFEIINMIRIPYLNWTLDDNLFLVARKLN